MVNPLRIVLDFIRGSRSAVLPPGRYTTKVRDAVLDPATGKVTITFEDPKPDTSPPWPFQPLRRLAKRKEP